MSGLKLPETCERGPQTILLSHREWAAFRQACVTAGVEPSVTAYTNWRTGQPLVAGSSKNEDPT